MPEKNFCSGSDVSKIIETLTEISMMELFAFSRMTGDLVKVFRNSRQPAIAAVKGVCTGARAMLAMASYITVFAVE